MRKSILLGLVALYFMAATAAATAQTFDPDPDQPGAQAQAEYRFQYSKLGLMPPPVGWICSLDQSLFSDVYVFGATCEPDPGLIAEQERRRAEWEREFERRSREVRARIGRGR